MRAFVAWRADGASSRYRADRPGRPLCAGLVSRPRPQGDAGRNRPGLARLSAVRLPPHAAPVAAQSTLAGEESLVRSGPGSARSEEHTSELQSLMRISYAVFCLKKKKKNNDKTSINLSTHTTRKRTTYSLILRQ